MWAALAALEDVEGLAERVEFNNSEVAYIESALGDIPGFIIFHSASNYILFDGTDTGKAGDDLVALPPTISFSTGRILERREMIWSPLLRRKASFSARNPTCTDETVGSASPWAAKKRIEWLLRSSESSTHDNSNRDTDT
jgi:hypothetical protein